MFNKIKLVLNNKTIMKRILFTLLILLVFKITTWIPIPLTDTTSTIKAMITENDFLSFLNALSGGGLGNLSIGALGISPYITASIVTQLLQMDIVPKFKEWSEQGEAGKQKLNRVTRYLAIFIAIANSLLILLGLTSGHPDLILSDEAVAVIPSNMIWGVYVYYTVAMVAGTSFILWLADMITRKGIGNGSSMIIVAGIVTTLPTAAVSVWNQFVTEGKGGWDIVKLIAIIIIFLAVIIGIVYCELAVRKIPVQYANRQGKTDSNIPLKLNSSSVIPVIFASTLLSIPLTVIGVLGISSADSGVGVWFDRIFSTSQPIGLAIYIILIYLFTFFYAFLQINPQKMADNLSKQNAYIPGVRPGDETDAFIARLLFKITIIGATLLVVLAIIPIITQAAFGLSSSVSIGGTSLLIVVGVAIETLKQITTEATEESYSGFIK